MRGEIDPGVGRVKEALRRLGQPEVDLRGRCLHVAGTNGKGSVTWLEPAAGEVAVPTRRVAVRVGLGEGREKPGWVDERNIAALPKSRTSTKASPNYIFSWLLASNRGQGLAGKKMVTPTISSEGGSTPKPTSTIFFRGIVGAL